MAACARAPSASRAADSEICALEEATRLEESSTLRIVPLSRVDISLMDRERVPISSFPPARSRVCVRSPSASLWVTATAFFSGLMVTRTMMTMASHVSARTRRRPASRTMTSCVTEAITLLRGIETPSVHGSGALPMCTGVSTTQEASAPALPGRWPADSLPTFRIDCSEASEMPSRVSVYFFVMSDASGWAMSSPEFPTRKA